MKEWLVGNRRKEYTCPHKGREKKKKRGFKKEKNL